MSLISQLNATVCRMRRKMPHSESQAMTVLMLQIYPMPVLYLNVISIDISLFYNFNCPHLSSERQAIILVRTCNNSVASCLILKENNRNYLQKKLVVF